MLKSERRSWVYSQFKESEKMIRSTMGCAVALAVAAIAPGIKAEVVFQNTNPDYTYFQPIAPGEEIGDDVTLDGVGRYITGFSVPITNTYLNPFVGSFTARFYTPDQDGLPGTQIWQGSLNTVNLDANADSTLDFGSPNVTVPDSFIWTLTADTVPAADAGNDESIGTLLNDVPQVGSSENVFLYNAHDGSGWGAFDYSPPDLANFEATITASVPEPATCSLLALGAVAGLVRRRRRPA
jgi:hypothetical protein